MVEATFVGDKPVDTPPTGKGEYDAKAEQDRLQKGENKQGGSAARQAVADKDPKEFDTSHRGGQGNTQPQADPVI